MLDILQFTQWLIQELGLIFYPLVFPATAPDTCNVVVLSDILGRKRDVKKLECTVYCRADRPDTAIAAANAVIKRLDRETSLVFDNTQVLSILAKTSSGQFKGTDKKGLYVFTASFNIIICDI